MIGFALGSFEASCTDPRERGVSRHGETNTPWASGSLMPSSTICTPATWNCVSGAGAPASTRAKPPVSARLDANGPVCVASYSSSAGGSSASSRLCGSGVVYTRYEPGWSERFSPTDGRSSSTSISRICRCSAGPTPESMRSCGEL